MTEKAVEELLERLFLLSGSMAENRAIVPKKPLRVSPSPFFSALKTSLRPLRLCVVPHGMYKTGFQSLELLPKLGSNHWKNGQTGFQ